MTSAFRARATLLPVKQSGWERVQLAAGRGGGGTAAAVAAVAVVAAAVLLVACFQVVAMAVFGTCLVALALLSGSFVAAQLLFSTKLRQKKVYQKAVLSNAWKYATITSLSHLSTTASSKTESIENIYILQMRNSKNLTDISFFFFDK